MLKSGGLIALMGSGELTTTMVEVHKSLLQRYGRSAHAVFVDTPAGFQLNVDQISSKVIDYFKQRVRQTIKIASFKSADCNAATAERAFARMRQADYLLVGPGSPTYALSQWQQSPVPDILIQRIKAGGCLVAASAAALTVGRLTVPVYEIYKVGMPVHWADGLDLLGRMGMDLAIIPHWNNAEGGNHDTRYCFMGASRLERLMDEMPQTTRLLGIDEHTALIIDVALSHASVQGIGRVTLKDRRNEIVFTKGDCIPLDVLRGTHDLAGALPVIRPERAVETYNDAPNQDDTPWVAIHAVAEAIRQALDSGRDEQVAGSLMELERLIWQSRERLEELNAMGAAREVLREVLAALTARLVSRPKNRRTCLAPVVDAVLLVRKQLRSEKKWQDADLLRICLEKAGIRVTDTPEGATWQMDP
jgi:cyanophycinase-like exopeptidase